MPAEWNIEPIKQGKANAKAKGEATHIAETNETRNAPNEPNAALAIKERRSKTDDVEDAPPHVGATCIRAIETKHDVPVEPIAAATSVVNSAEVVRIQPAGAAPTVEAQPHAKARPFPRLMRQWPRRMRRMRRLLRILRRRRRLPGPLTLCLCLL